MVAFLPRAGLTTIRVLTQDHTRVDADEVLLMEVLNYAAAYSRYKVTNHFPTDCLSPGGARWRLRRKYTRIYFPFQLRNVCYNLMLGRQPFVRAATL